MLHLESIELNLAPPHSTLTFKSEATWWPVSLQRLTLASRAGRGATWREGASQTIVATAYG